MGSLGIMSIVPKMATRGMSLPFWPWWHHLQCLWVFLEALPGSHLASVQIWSQNSYWIKSYRNITEMFSIACIKIETDTPGIRSWSFLESFPPFLPLSATYILDGISTTKKSLDSAHNVPLLSQWVAKIHYWLPPWYNMLRQQLNKF